MNRLIIERIEGRILVGITMFVAIMILVGWVAINEPARMASFERQHLGRSIERGAELYAANCATCHGTDGRGITERAPGLNSPHLFGYDFLASANNEIARLERGIRELETLTTELNTEREQLITEVGSPDTTDQRRNEIVARVTELNALIDPAGGQEALAQIEALRTELAGDVSAARTAEIEAEIAALTNTLPLPVQITLIEEALAPLLEARATQIEALLAAIDRGYLPGLEAAQAAGGLTLTEYLIRDANRLAQAGWAGDLASFLRTTLIHGRPGSQDAWGGNQMVAWAQTGGGPLRPDQVDDLVNYILNWDKGSQWTLEDLYGVNQHMKLKADAALVSAGPAAEVAGTDVDAIVAAIADLTGDPARGQAIYNGESRTEVNIRLGCSSCHLGGVQAPATEEQWNLVTNVRLNEPQLAGYTAEKYLVESIVAPNAYVVPNYASGVMPGQYGTQLSNQDIADIIAYVRSYSE